MKVRFFQIAVSDGSLYALDSNGQIWTRQGLDWYTIESPITPAAEPTWEEIIRSEDGSEFRTCSHKSTQSQSDAV